VTPAARREDFRAAHPDVFFLDGQNLRSLAQHLRGLGCLPSGAELLSASPAGEGNMNCTLRVRTSQSSIIVKQARPWVEKYPGIDAPWNRALREAKFYEAAGSDAQLSDRMPKLLSFDPGAKVLVLEDCGPSPDFTSLYKDAIISPPDLQTLTEFLIRLHTRFRDPSLASTFSDPSMRNLNHEHMFEFPLRPGNGLHLDAITPGLAALADQLRHSSAFTSGVAALGKIYLGEGRTLLHGDYFPGSWLKTASGVKIIDPEFCFFGLPEIDLGSMVAHLYLAQCPASFIEQVIQEYDEAASLDRELTGRFAGVEIMRRLIGVAQLPLPYGFPEKKLLLERSHRVVTNHELLY